MSYHQNPALDLALNAAKTGDIPTLQRWLLEGNDPNQRDDAGWSPLLWASVRGHPEAVILLLDNPGKPADAGLAHGVSGGLPLHLAGQSGDADTVLALLDHNPNQLDIQWDINGHTVLLQAVFYGHQPLARALLERGANTALTTARGLGPMELSKQFQNQPMIDLLGPYDRSATEKADNYKAYLARIAPVIPDDEKPLQELSDRLVAAIETGLKSVVTDSVTVEQVLATVRSLVETSGADVNRLGGPLSQPPLVVVATGINATPKMADLRLALAQFLLSHGASPSLCEKHPMAVQTIIRAAVFNHLAILRLCAKFMTPQELADGINMVPTVNGLTAMHDTVLRAGMAADDRFEGYLDQVRFFMQNGGRIDMEDYSGITQRQLAERAHDPDHRKRLIDVLEGRI
jgi:hypothetical protein